MRRAHGPGHANTLLAARALPLACLAALCCWTTVLAAEGLSAGEHPQYNNRGHVAHHAFFSLIVTAAKVQVLEPGSAVRRSFELLLLRDLHTSLQVAPIPTPIPACPPRLQVPIHPRSPGSAQ